MLYPDVAALVKNALTHIGCDSSLIGDLDSHSPIELTFDNTPNIYVSSTEQGIWLMSQLAQCAEEQVRVRAEEILMQVVKPRAWVDGDFLSLGLTEDGLWLKARLSMEALNAVELFADALGEFYELVGSLAKSMRQ